MSLRDFAERNGRDIVIVDSKFTDYAHLLSSEQAKEWNFHFLRTGAAARRHALKSPGDLWLINAQLSDMSGFELYRDVSKRLLKRPAIIVSERYDAAEELAAYQEHVTAYVVKPVDVSWLAQRKHTLVRSAT